MYGVISFGQIVFVFLQNKHFFQYAFNQNTMMLTLNDEKDNDKFMETGETLVKY